MSDPWTALRATTRARIGLGRTGDALPITDVLDFQLAHARARDAVHTALDPTAIAQSLAPLPTVTVRSKAPDRETYLRRPDLGRQLDPAYRLEHGPYDAVFVIADGLSPTAVHRHAAKLLTATLERMKQWSIAPIVIATQARVALGDEIGARLNATLAAVMIGERPGLSVADSLGVYLTYQPKTGRLRFGTKLHLQHPRRRVKLSSRRRHAGLADDRSPAPQADRHWPQGRSPNNRIVSRAITRSSSVGITNAGRPGPVIRPRPAEFSASSTANPSHRNFSSTRDRIGTLCSPIPAVNTKPSIPPMLTANAPAVRATW